MTTRLSLGEYVRHLRRRKRWGLQELSDATGLSVSHLSRIENDNAVPNADTVVKLATALGGDLEHMLGLAECLPQEILERLVRRAGGGAPAHRRSAGGAEDPAGLRVDEDFVRNFVEDIDPDMRASLARQFNVSETDVDGLFLVLSSVRKMSPEGRAAAIQFLAAAREEDSE